MRILAAAEGRFCQSYLIASSSLVLGVKYVKEEVQRQTFDKEEGRKASLSPSVPCLSSSLSLSLHSSDNGEWKGRKHDWNCRGSAARSFSRRAREFDDDD